MSPGLTVSGLTVTTTTEEMSNFGALAFFSSFVLRHSAFWGMHGLMGAAVHVSKVRCAWGSGRWVSHACVLCVWRWIRGSTCKSRKFGRGFLPLAPLQSESRRKTLFIRIDCHTLMSTVLTAAQDVNGTIDDCTFTNITADLAGGAIFLSNAGYVMIANSTFTECRARDGGAVSAVVTKEVTITGSRFTSNKVCA